MKFLDFLFRKDVEFFLAMALLVWLLSLAQCSG